MSERNGNVIPLGGVTRLDLPADRILEGAIGKLDAVLVIGYDESGRFYFASSLADGGDALWLVEQFKRALFDAAE